MILAAALGGYLIASLVLLKYPTLIHKKKQLKFRCRHISHRGGAGENLENTMAAFAHAYEVGTDMLELDCHITRDGYVVVSHDENLERISGYGILVSQTDFKDLPRLRAKLNLDFDPEVTVVTAKGSDRKVALLKDVFELYPKIPINIDIKVDNDQLIHEVSELVKLYHREAYTVWGNRSHRVLTKCYKENPSIPIFFSVRRVLLLVVYFYTGLLPFIPLTESCLEVIMPTFNLNEKKIKSGFSRKHRTLLKVIDVLLMRPSLFEHLEKRGIQTYLWVLNEEEEWRRAFRLGATGVMTDFPMRLKRFLDENPQPEKLTSNS